MRDAIRSFFRTAIPIWKIMLSGLFLAIAILSITWKIYGPVSEQGVQIIAGISLISTFFIAHKRGWIRQIEPDLYKIDEHLSAAGLNRMNLFVNLTVAIIYGLIFYAVGHIQLNFFMGVDPKWLYFWAGLTTGTSALVFAAYMARDAARGIRRNHDLETSTEKPQVPET